MALQSQRDQASRLLGLRSYARALAVSEEVAIEVYERELRILGDGATVERFVSILAEKHARAELKMRAGQ